MPVALVLRLLSRVLLVLGVVLFRRRVRGGMGVPPAHRTPGLDPGTAGMPGWLRALAAGTWLGRRAPDVAAGARMAGFALAFAAFGVASLALLSAGTTLATLGPRWLGAVMLVLAACLGVAAVREAVWLRRAVNLRRRRRRVEHLEMGPGRDG